MRTAFLLALGLAMLFAQSGGQAQGTTPLPYLPDTTGYLVTGDYVVGNVDFTTSMGGTIPISGVPQHADILAAFLYMEVIHPTSIPIQRVADFMTFRGAPIKNVRVKTVGRPLTGSTGACFTSGGPFQLRMTMLRADVLSELPRLLDRDGKPTGKLVVNSEDLASNGYSPHTVTAPDAIGNSFIQTAGASLVLLYRVLDPAEPLRSIVVQDGIHIQTGETTTQTIRRIYQSDTSNKKAKITLIGGKGATNDSSELRLNTASGTELIGSNIFPNSSKPSDRSWAARTFEVGPRMPGTQITGPYGETVTATLTYTRRNPFPCQSLAATWFSTNVLDGEFGGVGGARKGDGIPDRLEQEQPGDPVLDPDGEPRPNLYAMGARANQKDVFIEVNALQQTAADVTHGSENAPYDASSADPPSWAKASVVSGGKVISVTAGPHTHMPDPVVLSKFLKALADQGIHPHVDLGASYSDPGGLLSTYRIPAPLAQGGEVTEETKCDPGVLSCHFPAYAGVIGSGFSLQKHMRGLDIDPTGMTPLFEKNRDGLFHYMLYAHWRGKPKSLPCLTAPAPHGTPTLYPNPGSTSCSPLLTNPDFEPLNYHVPTTSSGFGDLPGPKAVIALGGWENFTGMPDVQASTSLHEFAHNLNIWHGGAPAELIVEAGGAPAAPGASAASGWVKFVHPNCKPNHFSVASYLFQVHLFKDQNNVKQIDLSHAEYAPLDESSLTDRDLSVLAGEAGNVALPYRAAWFAPLPAEPGTSNPPTLVDFLGYPEADRLCPGGPVPDGAVKMARFEALTLSNEIDWATDELIIPAPPDLGESAGGQDINLDGITNALTGFDDWANVRLDQVGGGYAMGGAISNGGEEFGGEEFGGEEFGGEEFGGEEFGGEEFGGFGGRDIGGEEFGGLDLDGSSFGASDFGGEEFGGTGELTRRDALGMTGGAGTPPQGLTATVLGVNTEPNCVGLSATQCHHIRLDWTAPDLGDVASYLIFRIDVTDTDGMITNETPAPVQIGEVPAPTTTFVDEELPNGRQYIYFVKAKSSDGSVSGPSNLAGPVTPITAVNFAPLAMADGPVDINEGTSADGNVLANDSDIDTAHEHLRAVKLTDPAVGVVVLEANGYFIYTPPDPDFFGQVSFTYRADDGRWSRAPLSPDFDSIEMTNPSAAFTDVATVTITVNPVNDAPSFTEGADQTVLEDAAPQTVAPWATGISAGPGNENVCPVGFVPPTPPPVVCPQTVSFLVTVPPDKEALFSAGPDIAPDGTLTYEPAPNANGTITVTVVAQDNGGTANLGIDTSPPQTFDITITPVNDPPIPGDDAVTTAEDTTLIIDAADLLVNDDTGPPAPPGTQDDESTQTLTVVTATADTHGEVSLSEDGLTITYVPDPDYNGPASFEYTVQDDGVPPQSAVGFVNVTVTEVNDSVVALDDVKSVPYNNALSFAATDLLANDSAGPEGPEGTVDDEPDQMLSVDSVTGTGDTQGAVVLNAGIVTYTPTPNFFGLASFTYEVCDDGTTAGAPAFSCATATVRVTVAQVFVSGFTGHTVVRVDPTTGGSIVIHTGNSAPNTPNPGPAFLPEDMVLGPDGKLYVCNSLGNQILRMNQDGSSVTVIYDRALVESGPVGPEGPSFYGTDLYFNTRSGSPSGVWKIANATSAPATPVNIYASTSAGEGTAFETSGSILIVDRAGSRVLRSNPPFGTATQIITTGTLLPFGIAVDAAGDIFVAVLAVQEGGSHTSGEIIRFNSSGSFIESYVTFDSPDGPVFLEFDSLGRLFVVTAQNGAGEVGKLWRIDGKDNKTLIANLDFAVGIAVPARFLP